jgi:transposase
MARTELSDGQLDRLLSLLPPARPRTGRPAKDLRRTLQAIFWVHRTGSPWRDLPAGFGPWPTAANRFYRWRRAGVWARVLRELQQAAQVLGKLDWTLHQVDSTVIRAHQHAAGGKGGRRPKRSAVRVAVSRPRSMSAAMSMATRSPSS